jgi:hypothetical protein
VSGPKEDAKVAPLKVYAVTGEPKDKEVDYAGLRKGKPTVYVFVSARDFDRPMFRFIKKLDEDLPEDGLVVAVWLTDDADKSKEYLPKIAQYFKGAALTVFGTTEGPKDWGINSDARLTAVVAHKGKVVKSLGYQSLNETDAPEVIEALKKAINKGQDKSTTPAEQYQALRKEYDRASSSGVPLTDAERLKFVGRAYKHRYALAQKFLELAQKYPRDPIALDALIQAVWQVNGTPWPVELVGEDTARARAFELLQRDHLRSEKLGPLCQRVSYGFCKEYETFLRAVLAKNPHKNVQATACLTLGQFLNSRLQRLDLCKEQPELAKEFAGLYGKEYLAQQQRQDREAVIQEIEQLFEQAVKKYGDEKFPGGGTVGEVARAKLFEIRNLCVGKEPPDIEGEDQDGKRFKLSDYRGKVVLLDFWSFV